MSADRKKQPNGEDGLIACGEAEPADITFAWVMPPMTITTWRFPVVESGAREDE